MSERPSDVQFVSDRQAGLLKKAANEFDNLSNPFVHQWLSKNEVTASECSQLSEVIAAILRWFVAQPNPIQAEVLLFDTDPKLARLIGLKIAEDNAKKRFEVGLAIIGGR